MKGDDLRQLTIRAVVRGYAIDDVDDLFELVARQLDLGLYPASVIEQRTPIRRATPGYDVGEVDRLLADLSARNEDSPLTPAETQPSSLLRETSQEVWGSFDSLAGIHVTKRKRTWLAGGMTIAREEGGPFPWSRRSWTIEGRTYRLQIVRKAVRKGFTRHELVSEAITELVDVESGGRALRVVGTHFLRSANSVVWLSESRHLVFPVTGSGSRQVMFCIDENGTRLAQFRRRPRGEVEAMIEPGRSMTPELVCILVVAWDFLLTFSSDGIGAASTAPLGE